MKYVCESCGEQLRIDRDVDNDAVFTIAVQRHRDGECPRQFLKETQWVAPVRRSNGTASWK